MEMMLIIAGIVVAVVAAVAGYLFGKKSAAPELVQLKTNLDNALRQVDAERQRTDELVGIERSRAAEQLETARRNAAEQLEALIKAEYPSAKTEIYACGGLCSFYAENHGMLVGFEKK